jgi:predicted DNA-binding transcriptional regulator AlpA
MNLPARYPLQEIISLLKEQAPRTQPPPWDKVLWTAEEIADYLRVSPRTVREVYAPQPGFPRPVSPGRHLRWYAHEVAEWVEGTRVKKVGRG